ncbi:hypothetical protein ACLKA6_009764 [Drosophila palustris]
MDRMLKLSDDEKHSCASKSRKASHGVVGDVDGSQRKEYEMEVGREVESKLNSGCESKSGMPSESLEDLVKMVLRMQIEEKTKESKIDAHSFANVLPNYDGESIPVEQWFDNFEEHAEAYGLTATQKYVQARGKMIKLAKLFLDSVTVSTYGQLKHEVMKAIADMGKVDLESVIEYIVDGLEMKMEYKFSMYNSMEPEIDFPHQFKNQVKELIKNSILNGAPAECPVIMKITPDGEIAPFRHAPRRLAIAEEEDVNKQINEFRK